MLKPVEKMVDSIDSADIDPVYDELKPFSDKIKKQYNEILKTANIREEFSANVSHELKTPLTAIAGYAELMESDPDTSDRHKHFSREIIKSAGRLRSLIDDTIMLSELDHSGERNLEMMRLDEVVGECVTMMKLNAEKKGIDLEYDSEPATVMGVSELITQMAENLIQNAINYNRDDGWVKVAVSRKDGKCILSVRDNGIGIPQEDQSRVFERFYRVERSRSRATGGTGLGLAIVKHIAEIHEADITLNSCINGGTEISVTFDEAYTR
jgi:two-component system phosphate regulon sensor histidine kinase PhoR